jgi:hypothetical protein
VDEIETVKNNMKQIVKNDNINSKQITELEQSEGISIKYSQIIFTKLVCLNFFF